MQIEPNDYDYWSKFADTFDDDNNHIIGKTTNDAIKMWLENQFDESDLVLELGCGSGFTSLWIAPIVNHLTATDMSEEMILIARERLSIFDNVEVNIDNCYGTSFDDRSFDAVLMANLLHLVRKPSTVLNESYRILKDGGRLVVVDYTSFGLSPEKKKEMMRRYFSRWGPVPEQSFAASPDILTVLAEQAGFTVEESILVGENTKSVCLKAVKE